MGMHRSVLCPAVLVAILQVQLSVSSAAAERDYPWTRRGGSSGEAPLPPHRAARRGRGLGLTRGRPVAVESAPNWSRHRRYHTAAEHCRTVGSVQQTME